MQVQLAGQFALPDDAHTPVSRTSIADVATPAVQFIVMLGACSPFAQLLRATLKMAVQPFPAAGVCVRVTVTPACGLDTLKVNPLIAVVPPGRSPAMLTDVEVLAVPAHTRESVDPVQAPGADGYRAPSAWTSAAVTAMPLIVVGACAPHAHVALQFAVPDAAQFPLSCTDQVLAAANAVPLKPTTGSGGKPNAHSSLVQSWYVIVQPFACVGAPTSVKVWHPPVSLLCTALKPLIDVVPAGRYGVMFRVKFVFGSA